MGDRGGPPRAIAWATVAILGLAAATGGGCELAVGDGVPSFHCVGVDNTCPSDEICSPATLTCVPLSSTCIGAACAEGFFCDRTALECVPIDASGLVDSATAPSDSDDGSDAALDSASAEDANALDAAPRLDAGGSDAETSDADGGVSGDDDEASTLDAATDADATIGPAEDASIDSGLDATTHDDGSPGQADAEGGPSEDGPYCEGPLCQCSAAANCAGGVCADQSTVTSALYAQAGNANFCTQPCCSSADCDPSTVCFGTGAGGNYCVDPAWLSRSTALGTLLGGATCSTNSQCRSGLCAAGTCADTCCSSAQASTACASGVACNLGTFPGQSFDTHRTGFCGASSSACGFAPCIACRTSSDCSDFVEVCSYGAAAVGSSDIVATCAPGQAGSGAQGDACGTNSACASGYCDSLSQECSDVCFTDDDCNDGWHCRVEDLPIVNGGGNYSLLRCGN